MLKTSVYVKFLNYLIFIIANSKSILISDLIFFLLIHKFISEMPFISKIYEMRFEIFNLKL